MNIGIKPPELEILESEPFLNDKLGRKENAEILTSLISDTKEPLVLAINSPWGFGKTTFVRMWKKLLENDGFHSIYFNAWENDFSEDPLVAFIGEINQEFESKIGKEDKASPIGKAFLATKKYGKHLLKRSIPLAVKLGTSGLLDIDKATEDEISSLAEKIASEKIENYEKDKNTIKSFRDNLESFVLELQQDKKQLGKPIVFFVDELDRCRPNYAIELLERIKHLFSVEGIVFVLSLDREQLEHSVKAIYGVGMNAEGYLRRFIDIQYKLPDPNMESYCSYLFDRFGFGSYFEKRTGIDADYDRKHVLESIIRLSKVFGFSLRTVYQCFIQLSIVLKCTPTDKKLYALLVTSLVAIKAANQNLYVRFVEGSANYEEVLDFIASFPDGKTFLNEHLGEFISAYLITCRLDSNKVFNVIEQNTKKLNDESYDSFKKTKLSSMNEFLHSFRKEKLFNKLNYVLRKIEIAEQFSSNV